MNSSIPEQTFVARDSHEEFTLITSGRGSVPLGVSSLCLRDVVMLAPRDRSVLLSH
jgi:hypothetical protein